MCAMRCREQPGEVAIPQRSYRRRASQLQVEQAEQDFIPRPAGHQRKSPVAPRIAYTTWSNPNASSTSGNATRHHGLRRPVPGGVGRLALLPPRLPLSLSHCHREGCARLFRNALPPLPRPRRRRTVAAPRPRQLVGPLPRRLRIHAERFAGALLQGGSGE
jgi:hypothetical protein